MSKLAPISYRPSTSRPSTTYENKRKPVLTASHPDLLETDRIGLNKGDLKKAQNMMEKFTSKIPKQRLKEAIVKDISIQEFAKSVDYVEDTEIGRYICEFQALTEDQGKFIYLAQKIVTNCYDLQEVNYEQAENEYGGRFWTLSKKGFTEYYSGKPVDFLSTTDWLIEKAYFEKVSELNFFRNFRKWKAYKQWHRKVILSKRQLCKSSIKSKSFIIHEAMRDVIFRYKNEFYDALNRQKLRLFNFNISYKEFNFNEFLREQITSGNSVKDSIRNLSLRLRVLFTEAMNLIISKLKDEFNKDAMEEVEVTKVKVIETKRMQVLDEVYERLGFPQRLSYKQKSELRKECISFIRMSYLLDFVVQTFLKDLFTISRNEIDLCFHKLNSIPLVKQGSTAKKEITSREFTTPLFKLDVQFSPITSISQSRFVEVELPEISLGMENEDNVKNFDPMHHLSHKGDLLVTKTKKMIPKDLHLYWLNITPNKDEIIAQLAKTLEINMESLCMVTRWSKHEDLNLYASVLEEWDDKVADTWEIANPKYVRVNNSSDGEKKYEPINDKMIIDHIAEAFKRCQEFFSQLEHVLYIYWRNNKLNYSMFADENLNHLADVYKLMFKQFDLQRNTIQASIVEEASVGMFKLCLLPLRNQLLESNKNSLAMFENTIKPFINSQYAKTQSWISSSIDSLGNKIQGRPDYIKRLEILKSIKEDMQYYSDKIDLLALIHTVMNEWKVTLPKEDDDKEITSGYHRLMEEVANKEDKCMKNREKYKKIIEQELVTLTVTIDELEVNINDPKFLMKESIASSMIRELNLLNNTFTKLLEQSKVYVYSVKIMQLNEVSFPKLDEIKHSIDLRYILWNSYKEWSELSAQYTELQFNCIDAAEITAKASQYYKNIIICDKQMPDSTAVKELKELIRIFKDAMPVVVALANKDLDAYYLGKLQLLVGDGIVLKDRVFKLGQLLKSRAIECAYEIMLQSESATQRKQLTTKMESINNRLEDRIFSTAPYREGTAEMSYLCNIDALVFELENDLTEINEILGSKFVNTVEPKINTLKDIISTMISNLLLIKKVQENWKILERVFSVQGIKTILVKESQEFDSNNKSWLSIIKKLSNKKLKESIKDSKDFVKTIFEIGKKLETCVKRLYEYIDTKRKDNPRLYFISDEEMCNIISKYSDYSSVEYLLAITFNGIKSIITDANDVKNQIGDNKNPSKMLGFKSIYDEDFRFKASFAIKIDKSEGLGTWTAGLEKNIYENLQNKIKSCYTEVLDKFNDGKKDWIFNYPPQVVFVVFRVIWTEGCQLCIDNIEKGFREQANFAFMYEDQLENIKQLRELAEECAKDTTNPPYKLKMLNGLIAYLIFSRDIIEKLVDASINSLSSFLWQRQFKYIIEDKVLKIHVLDKSIPYSYTYFADLCPLPVCDSIENEWISIVNIAHSGYSNIIHGKIGVGKKEIVLELAKLLGIQTFSFQCNQYTDFDALFKPTNGCCQSGFWLIYDGLQEVSTEALSIYGLALNEIYKAIEANKQLITINDKEYEMKFTSNTFSIFSIQSTYPIAYPKELKKMFRPTKIINPEIKSLLKYSFELKSITNYSATVSKIIDALDEFDINLCQTSFKFKRLLFVKKVIECIKVNGKPNITDSEIRTAIYILLKSCLSLEALKQADSILNSIFGKIEIAQVVPSKFLKESAKKLNIQLYDDFEQSYESLQNSLQLNTPVIILGEPAIGKSTLIKLLQNSLNCEGKIVIKKVFNINSLTPQQFIGPYLDKSGYREGILSRIIKKIQNPKEIDPNMQTQKPIKQKPTDIWMVFDGSVDPIWTEIIKPMIEFDKSICLFNGDKLVIPSICKTIFEMTDITQLDPSIIYRSSLIYLRYSHKILKNYFNSWVSTVKFTTGDDMLLLQLQNYFDDCTEKTIKLLSKERDSLLLPVSYIHQVITLCKLLDCFFTAEMGIEDNKFKSKKMIIYFSFAYIWAFGGCIHPLNRPHFDELVRAIFPKVPIPVTSSVFDFGWVNEDENVKIMNWAQFDKSQIKLPNEINIKSSPHLFIPNEETIRIHQIMKLLIIKKYPIAIIGSPCVGKTIATTIYVQTLLDSGDAYALFLNKTKNLSAESIFNTLELKIDRKRSGNVFGPYGSKYLCYIIDDIHLPTDYKASHSYPDDAIRQIVDLQSYYTFENHRKLCDVWPIILADACHWDSPPSRLLRHFVTIGMHLPGEETLKNVYESYISYHFSFDQYKQYSKVISMVCYDFSVKLHSMLTLKWRNLASMRSIIRICRFTCFQCNAFKIPCAEEEIYNIWISNAIRECVDKVFDTINKEKCINVLLDIAQNKMHLSTTKEDIVNENAMLYVHKTFSENSGYFRVKDQYELVEECKTNVQVLTKYSEPFQDVIIQITPQIAINVHKVIRALSMKNGHCLLIGGSGRAITSKIAIQMLGYQLFEVKTDIKRIKRDLLAKLVETIQEKKQLVIMLNDKGKECGDSVNEILDIIISGKLNLEYGNEEIKQITKLYEKDTKKSPEIQIRMFNVSAIECIHVLLCIDKQKVIDLMMNQREFSTRCTYVTIDDWALIDYEKYCYNELIKDISAEESKEIGKVMGSIYYKIEPILKQHFPYLSQRNLSSFICKYKQICSSKKNTITIENTLFNKIITKVDFLKEQISLLTNQLKNSEPEMKQLQDQLESLKPQKNDLNKKLMNAEAELERNASILGSLLNRIELATEDLRKQEKAMEDSYNNVCKDLLQLNNKDMGEQLMALYNLQSAPATYEVVIKTAKKFIGDHKEESNEWKDIKSMFREMPKYVEKFRKFKPISIKGDEALIKNAKGTFVDASWNKEIMEKHVPIKLLADWCQAVIKYDDNSKVLLQQKQKKDKASKEYNDMQDTLKISQTAFEAVKVQVTQIEEKYTTISNQLQERNTNKGELQAKKENADTFVKFLTPIYIKCSAKLVNNESNLKYLRGNCLVESAIIEQLSPLSSNVREECTSIIVKACQELNFNIQNTMHLVCPETLSIEADSISCPLSKAWADDIQLLKMEDKYPIAYDPYGIMEQYLTKTEKKLVVVSLKSRESFDLITTCMREGSVLLLQDIEFSEDSIRPILDKELHIKARNESKSTCFVNISNKKCELASGFKLYGITKKQKLYHDEWFYKKTRIINCDADRESLSLIAYHKAINIIDVKMVYSKEENSKSFLTQTKIINEKEASISDKFSKAPNDALFEDKILISKIEAISEEIQECQKRLYENKSTVNNKNSSFTKFRPVSDRFCLIYDIVVEFQSKVFLLKPNFLSLCNILTNILKTPVNSEQPLIETLIKSISISLCKEVLKSLPYHYKLSFLLRFAQEIALDADTKAKIGVLMSDAPVILDDKPDYIDIDAWSWVKYIAKQFPKVFKDLPSSVEKFFSLWQEYFKTGKNIPSSYSKITPIDKVLIAHGISRATQFKEIVAFFEAQLGKEISSAIYDPWEDALQNAIVTGVYTKPISIVCYDNIDVIQQLRSIQAANEKYANVIITPFVYSPGQAYKLDYFLEKNREKCKGKGNWAVIINAKLTNKFANIINKHINTLTTMEMEGENMFKVIIHFKCSSKTKIPTKDIGIVETISALEPIHKPEYYDYLKKSLAIEPNPINDSNMVMIDVLQILCAEHKLDKYFSIKANSQEYVSKMLKSLFNAYKDSKVDTNEIINYYIKELMIPSNISTKTAIKTVEDILANPSKYEPYFSINESNLINNALCTKKIVTMKKTLSSLTNEELSVISKSKNSQLPLIIEGEKIGADSEGGQKIITPLSNLVQKEAQMCNSIIFEVKSKVNYAERQLNGSGLLTEKGKEIIECLMNEAIITYSAKSIGLDIEPNWATSISQICTYYKDWLANADPFIINLNYFIDPKALMSAIKQTLAMRFKLDNSLVTLELKPIREKSETINGNHPSGYYCTGIKTIGFNQNMEPTSETKENLLYVLVPLIDKKPNVIVYKNTGSAKRKVGSLFVQNAQANWRVMIT